MEKECNLDVTHDFFPAKKLEDIAILSFKENLLLRAIDVEAKTSLFDCLELISNNRMYNAVNQFILTIMGFDKIVVHAGGGKVISLFMNTSLACDYRMVADNTVFQNPYLELDLVPKGGGAFFLSQMLGRGKAFEILLSGKDITAQEAMRLGIVDKVVPQAELEEAARKVAKSFARKPGRSLSGIKTLLSYSLKDLKDSLELENQLLLRMVGREVPYL